LDGNAIAPPPIEGITKMPTLAPSVRRTEDQKAAPSTHLFETIHTEPKQEAPCPQHAVLLLLVFMLAAIVTCGAMLWVRVNL
jgi:hypothetical protein